MALEQRVKNLINELANELRRVLEVQTPIENIDSIIYELGGRIREDKNLSEYSDGFVRRLSDGEVQFEIVVSPYQPRTRRNFTIAHELGHLFLHMGFIVDPDLWEKQDEVFYRRGNSDEEYAAHEFAAAFLMPKDEYKKIMDENTNNKRVNISRVAEYFHVSENAASNRGKWLGYLEW